MRGLQHQPKQSRSAVHPRTSGQEVEIVTIGRKGRDFFRRRPVNILSEYINVTARTIDHEDAAAIARDLMEMYTAEGSTIDKVYPDLQRIQVGAFTAGQRATVAADRHGSI